MSSTSNELLPISDKQPILVSCFSRMQNFDDKLFSWWRKSVEIAVIFIITDHFCALCSVFKCDERKNDVYKPIDVSMWTWIILWCCVSGRDDDKKRENIFFDYSYDENGSTNIRLVRTIECQPNSIKSIHCFRICFNVLLVSSSSIGISMIVDH